MSTERPQIWAVFNGYTGNGAVCCLVEADNADEACALATPELHTEAFALSMPEAYWTDLRAERLTLPYLTEMG